MWCADSKCYFTLANQFCSRVVISFSARSTEIAIDGTASCDSCWRYRDVTATGRT